MKPLIKLSYLKMFAATLLLSCVQLVLWAQDSTSTATSTTSTRSTSVSINENGDWYTQPWVWLVGAAVFILLLIALLRGGGGSRRTDTAHTDRVTVTKTVREERDTDTV